MKTKARECGWCGGGEGRKLMICTKCKLVDYCGVECQTQDWKAGHKIFCAKLPKAVKKAKEKIASFSISDYTTRHTMFMVTEAEAERGQIYEEGTAQELCYDAMEMTKGSTEKLMEILCALDTFPLSTEAWGMLGHFYQYEIDPEGFREKLSCAEALKMYDTAILCARKLNPTWSDDRSEELSWGEMGNRPYMRALLGRALCLKKTGKREEAIRQAKKLLRLNPGDNQGVRKMLCSWFIESKDTEGCTNLLRKFNTKDDASLAYTDVLLQYLRWKKDDVVENDVKLALYTAIQTNPYVPDILARVHGFDDDEDEDDEASDSNDGYYSLGGSDEAKMYAKDSRKLWKKYPDALSWMKSLKFNPEKVPAESDLINLLRSGVKLRVKCIHSKLDGSDITASTLIGTQRRNKCIGCGLPNFYWPRSLNQPHQLASDILIHNNVFGTEEHWRRTDYCDVEEVPYWEILLQFYADDEDYIGDYRDEPKSWKEDKEKERPKFESTGTLKCKECGSDAKFYALDNDSNDFYCSKSCMENFLAETEPPYLELDSETFKLRATGECSIRTIDLDHALQVARDYMPNLKYVDIFVDQHYILEEMDCSFELGEPNPNFVLSAPVLEQFLESKSADLVAFVFHLDDCCWEEVKALTNRCRAFAPLARMPNLKKLSLRNFGFDDVETITMCLNSGLESLCLDHAAIGFERVWSKSQVDALVKKLSQLSHLVSLSLSDIPITDCHLRSLLPRFHNRLRCLHLCGAFGDSTNSPLTDNGMKAIAEHCPSILTVDVDYQGKVGSSGILTLVQKCPNLLEIGACATSLTVEDVRDILNTPNNLLILAFGQIGRRPSNAENKSLQNAVVSASNGRVVICTMYGRVEMSLLPEHQANQDASIAKIDRAHEQQRDPMFCNKWDGDGWW
mmetsp:Transcript_3459/g.5264  ORF Transcript_3459/g.5264 Transcript_3459/m.5264 type:complete len:907 (-) Transcript_3459:1869-4589(-)